LFRREKAMAKKKPSPPPRPREHKLLGLDVTTKEQDAEWQAYLAHRPQKGPDCPLESDLLDLAHEHLDKQRAAEVEAHLSDCVYCRQVVAFLRKPAPLRGSLLEAIALSVRGSTQERFPDDPERSEPPTDHPLS
jgi:hypothetical protein